MIKRIILSIFILSIFISGSAQNADVLLVTCKNGNLTNFSLHESPTIVLSEDSLLIKTPNLTSTFDMSDVSSLKYISSEDISSYINDLDLGNNQCISIEDDHIIVRGSLNERITIYTISGLLHFASILDASGTLSIPISNIQSGVYILTTSKNRFKLKVR